MIKVKLDTTQAKKTRVDIEKDGKIILSTVGESPLPTIDKALKQAHLDLEDIECFISNPGPGSFTGVRIGAAVVNSLNLALGKKAPLIKPIYD